MQQFIIKHLYGVLLAMASGGGILTSLVSYVSGLAQKFISDDLAQIQNVKNPAVKSWLVSTVKLIDSLWPNNPAAASLAAAEVSAHVPVLAPYQAQIALLLAQVMAAVKADLDSASQ